MTQELTCAKIDRRGYALHKLTVDEVKAVEGG